MTTLFVDVSNLAWRAQYTTGHLEYRGAPAGVVFGFLQEVRRLRTKFATDDIAFFFDHPHYFRRDDFPWYKLRNYLPGDPRTFLRKAVHAQVNRLREEVLPGLGFVNLFYEDGFEADDLMCVAATHAEGVTLVSSDEDLYQLLRRGVCVHKPSLEGVYTRRDFALQFRGLSPSHWPRIKAVAGCKSDNVAGCDGVGEAYAAQYFAGVLSNKTQVYGKIQRFMASEKYAENLRVVTLPYKPVRVEWKKQAPLDRGAWNGVVRSMDMDTLAEVRRGLAT